MNVRDFAAAIGADFYTGVPDSQLAALCNYLMDTYGIDPQHHIIAANEGNCTALAAGYHLDVWEVFLKEIYPAGMVTVAVGYYHVLKVQAVHLNGFLDFFKQYCIGLMLTCINSPVILYYILKLHL